MGAPPNERRRVPLRTWAAEPHACPRPVRMSVLSQVEYFSDLTTAELADIDRRMVSLAWGEDVPLYRAGEPAEHLYVIADGRVKLVRPTSTGGEVLTDVLGPGSLLGALSTLGEPLYDATAVAMVTTCALRIDPGAFRDVLAAHPSVALRVLDDVAARLRDSRGDVARQTSPVPQRLAAVLLRLAESFGQRRAAGGELIQVPLSRADLAGMTGSTPESVSRTMSRWRRDGLIDSGRRWTTILDPERLRQVAAGE